jgi:predicted Zn-dependent protease
MDETLNAFALPGGKVFVNAGAIMRTDSEAELAGLLAHEVAHAALSHGFQLMTQGNLTANVVSYIPYVGNAASSLIVLNYSRDMEQQADIVGTRILVNAGYAADGVHNLMVQLRSQQDKDNPEPPAWLSSHPNTKQRISYMEQVIVDHNLNRFTYEGVAPHQEIQQLARVKWQKYEKCVEDVNDIERAKECAGNKDEADKPKGDESNQDKN